MTAWDHEVDFLVAGSGAAAMAAGVRAHDLGMNVLLVEKGAQYGGSSAMSGGVCWVGNNPMMAKIGVPDSDEDVLAYLKHITKGEVDEAYLRTYRDTSKRMLAYLAERSHLRFMPIEGYTDYYPEAPGGKLGGRSLEPVPFDGALLGDDFDKLRRPATSALVLGKFMITARIAKRMVLLGVTAMMILAWLMLRYAFRYPSRVRFGGRDPYLTNGNALIARLRLSLKDRGVPIWLDTPIVELVTTAGRITGAVVEREGKPYRIGAKRGVLLATGGFDRNLAMRTKYGPSPASVEWTAGNELNTGDGIDLGMKAGGDVALMDEAWWTPTTQYPGVKSGWVLVLEKSLPGGIFVNRLGKRYGNEAAPYVDVAKAMYDDHAKTGASVPGWMVFDARYRHNYLAGPVGPGKAMPDKVLSRKLRKEFLVKAPSIRELAEKLSIDPDALDETVERYNRMARAGKDEDFGRGESASDRYYSDERVKPNPCMAPIERGPFYAIPIFPGDLGTKGGLRTDTTGRVLDAQSRAIPGLYAAGNASASIMGRTYPGAGGTIGPAMCFGFLSAEAAAAEESAVTRASDPVGVAANA